MPFRLSLHDRQRFARNKRDRYRRDPDFRLRCINASRAQRGAAPISSLSQMGDRFAGRPNGKRDNRGRFVPA